MSKIPAEHLAKWNEITKFKYAEQAKWVLNGFWDNLEKEAERIWGFVQEFNALDALNKEKACGYSLDEFWSHKFLEKLGETMTVIQLREKMRSIDLDFDKKMSMIEYLIFRYGISIQQVVNAPQGGNPEELKKAQVMVDNAQNAVSDMLKHLEIAKASAKAAEAAEAENKAALEELHNQEKAYADKKTDLEKKSQEGGVVMRNKAANELQQLLAEDPLPLRRAKINQEATVKKSEKATAKAKADEAAAQNSVKEAEKKLQEAMDYLQEAKRSSGGAMGNIWWMEREIIEKKKYLPKSKQ
eukprot:TRINITY_DN1442_c0_g1_i1.p1 TRINITY_DN1442_c0_g1~~TRINITY_DN1442_c0_g1_i1.p1  ORF type:complete len:299 (-),score=107.40 TRINITY_DN1442_c0_g1_i1:83-979(-)